MLNQTESEERQHLDVVLTKLIQEFDTVNKRQSLVSKNNLKQNGHKLIVGKNVSIKVRLSSSVPMIVESYTVSC